MLILVGVIYGSIVYWPMIIDTAMRWRKQRKCDHDYKIIGYEDKYTILGKPRIKVVLKCRKCGKIK